MKDELKILVMEAYYSGLISNNEKETYCSFLENFDINDTEDVLIAESMIDAINNSAFFTESDTVENPNSHENDSAKDAELKELKDKLDKLEQKNKRDAQRKKRLKKLGIGLAVAGAGGAALAYKAKKDNDAWEAKRRDLEGDFDDWDDPYED